MGFRFSAVFGFFEAGDFAVTLPVEGEIHEVILKSHTGETTLWLAPQSTELRRTKMMNKYFTSRMLSMSGGLMTVCGILMALLGQLAIGGIYWAAASCLFFAACHFRLAGNKKEHEEETKNE